jgi:heavy metal sensor kinase
MSLNARLSAFFLATLAVVLATFSASLYLLAQEHFHRQAEERLRAGLDTLTAAADKESAGIEWEPQEKHLTLGNDPADDQVRWVVHGDGREPKNGRSRNLGAGKLEAPAEDDDRIIAAVGADGAPWYFVSRRVRVEDEAKIASGRYRVLILQAGLSLASWERTLRTLLIALIVLSVSVWLAAALAGRFLARRALSPLTRMAVAARAMDAADLHLRLPEPGTGDELDDLRRAFNDLLDRLQEAFERQRRFTGDASHQLRTPLTAMLGQIEVALRRDRASEEYRHTLELARGQASHLRKIVEALLFLTRADLEAVPGAMEEADLAAWLPAQIERWSGHARAADLRTDCPAGDRYIVRVQPVLLGQLLDNLLENAFKYSEPGGPVTVEIRRDKDTIMLAVRDMGRGIAPEDLPHVFEPFYRSAEARRLGRPGVGLGLAVVRRIALALGGDVGVESQPRSGCRFTLRLPSVPGAQVPAPAVELERSAVAS